MYILPLTLNGQSKQPRRLRNRLRETKKAEKEAQKEAKEAADKSTRGRKRKARSEAADASELRAKSPRMGEMLDLVVPQMDWLSEESHQWRE